MCLFPMVSTKQWENSISPYSIFFGFPFNSNGYCWYFIHTNLILNSLGIFVLKSTNSNLHSRTIPRINVTALHIVNVTLW